MTYKELMNKIFQMSPEQQNMDLAFFDKEFNEFYQVELWFTTANDAHIIEVNHPYFRRED